MSNRTKRPESARQLTADAVSTHTPNGLNSRWMVVAIAVALALATLAVYWQVHNFGFVNYDDEKYVAKNPHILGGLNQDGILWAFTTSYIGYWQPMTWLSLMLDCQLFGPDPGWMHMVNVLLHLANTLLLFTVLKKMSGALWPSAFVAAAFALHPMHVESVAWITERKDVLNALFLLLTLAAYVNYVRHHGVWRYLLTILLFATGLLGKPMLVTLPPLLLLLDYWPLGRFDLHQTGKASSHMERQSSLVYDGCRIPYTVIIEKIPFFVLSAVSSVIAFLTQKAGGGMVDTTIIPLKDRIGNALLSYAVYIGKMFWPRNMAAYYPHGAVGSMTLRQFLPYILLMAGISLLVVRFGRTRKYLLVGWFWFVGTLIPVIGLVKFTSSSYADRFTYIPYVGLFIMIAWGLPELLSKWPRREYAVGITGVIALAVLGICAHKQAGYWRDSLTLFSHAIEVTQNNDVAYSNRGGAYGELGRWQEAIDAYKQALRIRPDDAEVYYDLGVAYAGPGRWQEAIDAHKQALEIRPDYAEAYNNLGIAYSMLGRYQDAVDAYRQAIRIKPDITEAYHNIGLAYIELGQWQEAIDAYEQALKIKSDSVETRYNLGNVYGRLGRWQEAMDAFGQAIKIKPDYAEAHNSLGQVYSELGRWQEAIDEFRQAIKIKPDYAEAHNSLGNVYSRLGRWQDAIDAHGQAIRINPDYVEARYSLATELLAQGRCDEAVDQYHAALRLKPDWLALMNDLAWLIATNPAIENRDTNEAIRLASRACELSDYKDVAFLDTLAAAYASAARFGEAVDMADRALNLADAANQPQLRTVIQSHLSFYRQSKPYLEPSLIPPHDPNKP